MKTLPRKFRNQVIQGDVIDALRALPADCLDMIYGDPDYNVGVVYAGGKRHKKAWDAYIEWYSLLARESLRVLKPTGNLFLINYPKQNAHLRAKFLDDAAHDVQDYAWVYNTNVGHSKRRFTTAHRSILHATKARDNKFFKNAVAVPYQNPTDKRIKQRITDGHPGRMPYSWFYFDLVKNVSKDKTFHSCQIPLALVEMLIKSCTVERDDIFILFGGSGSEIVLAQQLKRNFVSTELNDAYHKMILDRLDNGGVIDIKYRHEFIQKRHGNGGKVVDRIAQHQLLENRAKYQ